MKQAKTPEEKKFCFDFLKEHGTIPSTDLYFYEGQAVAGVELCLGDTSKIMRIEPFQSDNVLHGLRLFEGLHGLAYGWGCSHIICMTNRERTQEILQKKFKFKFWAESLNHYISEL